MTLHPRLSIISSQGRAAGVPVNLISKPCVILVTMPRQAGKSMAASMIVQLLRSRGAEVIAAFPNPKSSETPQWPDFYGEGTPDEPL